MATRKEIIQAEINAIFGVFRKDADASGYGFWISNANVIKLTDDAVNAVEGVPHNDDRKAMIQAEVNAIFKVVRADIDASGYGGFITDDKVNMLTTDAVNAAEGVRAQLGAPTDAKPA